VKGNPNLPQCQVDALVDQLETRISCTECIDNGQIPCEE